MCSHLLCMWGLITVYLNTVNFPFEVHEFVLCQVMGAWSKWTERVGKLLLSLKPLYSSCDHQARRNPPTKTSCRKPAVRTLSALIDLNNPGQPHLGSLPSAYIGWGAPFKLSPWACSFPLGYVIGVYGSGFVCWMALGPMLEIAVLLDEGCTLWIGLYLLLLLVGSGTWLMALPFSGLLMDPAVVTLSLGLTLLLEQPCPCSSIASPLW